jgi:hypothetical protein
MLIILVHFSGVIHESEEVSAPKPRHQDCQMFLGTTFPNGKKRVPKFTKWPLNIPNVLKTY